MKINFKTVLTTLDNEPIQIPAEVQSTCQVCGHVEEQKDLTLERVSFISFFKTK